MAAGDGDAARAVARGRETLGALLRTAQKRLQRVFIAFVLGLVGGILMMRWYVWPKLKADLLVSQARIVAQTPFDVILLQVKIGMVVGILVALPVLLYYAREPLQKRGIVQRVPVSRRKAAAVAGVALLLFLGGATYAYKLFFPIMLAFLASNATSAGLGAMYSIVAWTEFILVMGLSFGLAAQLPLAMSALSYSGVVPYEVFRDNWKYAVVIMFTFGAAFSPPDPFTQIMWAAPLCGLYAFSLYVSKIVVTAKRGRTAIDVAGVARAKWNRIAGGAVLVGGAVYAFFSGGGVALLNRLLPYLPSLVRPAPFRPVEVSLGVSRPLAVGLFVLAFVLAAVVLLLGYYVYQSIAALGAPPGRHGSPTAIDVGELDAAGVRAAPPEAFVDLGEEEAVELAGEAMDAGDPEKARAILDRFDEGAAMREARAEAVQSTASGSAPQETATSADEGGLGSRLGQRAVGVVDAFTEEETTEDDIGGYYYDIAFILDSLRSGLFRIAAVFLAVLAGVFWFLYSGGIGTIRADFLARMPADLRPVATAGASQWPITLHPVEALIFEVKISAVLATVAILPLVAYHLWPALRERGLARGDRRTLLVWGGSLFAALAVGSVVGYIYVAPTVVSWLAADAVDAGMVIVYRVNTFFWMVFLTTAGIGLLADIPVTMVLFHFGGIVSYRRMRQAWRGVALATFVFAAAVTPSSLYTMLLIGVPMVVAYWAGLGLLWLFTLGGRRGGRKPQQATAD